MEKVKLEFKPPINKTIEYSGVIIEINPYITLSEQVFLIDNYLKDLFDSENQYPYLIAEYNMLTYILQLKTNLDTDNLDNDIFTNVNFWGKILGEIINYNDFKEKLNVVVSDKKKEIEHENSTGKILKDFIDNLYNLLGEFSKITPEQIESLQAKGIELANSLEKNSILNQAPKRAPRKKSKDVGEA